MYSQYYRLYPRNKRIEYKRVYRPFYATLYGIIGGANVFVD